MKIAVTEYSTGTGTVVKIRCPVCGNNGTFDPFKGVLDLHFGYQGKAFWLGLRRCPNSECNAPLFFIMEGSKIVVSYPAERIDFKKEKIPDKVISTFEEAITCHSEKCFIAAGIMIRRTLEEICLDKGATGDNLKKRINALKDKIVIPKELFEGMDELRLLGNDASHIESRAFSEIGKEEIEVGIEFAKEILKAVYQYSDLLFRMRNLKKKDKAIADA